MSQACKEVEDDFQATQNTQNDTSLFSNDSQMFDSQDDCFDHYTGLTQPFDVLNNSGSQVSSGNGAACGEQSDAAVEDNGERIEQLESDKADDDKPIEKKAMLEEPVVLLTAPTGKAANLLGKKAQLPSFTLHRVIYR